MKILSIEQIREADAYTIKYEPIGSIDLMERAASQIYHAITHRCQAGQHFCILAGPGNNGGDGIALARMLVLENYPVDLYILSGSRGFSEDAQVNIDRLPDVSWLKTCFLDPKQALPDSKPSTIIIDALFGSGLTRSLSDYPLQLVEWINRSDSLVIAIDIPSGLFGEDNQNNPDEGIVKADLTLTLQFPKLAFLFPENQWYIGEWEVLPIGLHPDFIREVKTSFYYFDERALPSKWMKRLPFSHKGHYGHAALAAGAHGKMGAAVLAAKACMRTGVGLLTCYTPADGNSIMQHAVPEAMTICDPNDDELSECPHDLTYSAIGVGPGIGTGVHPTNFLQQLIDRVEVPMVMDADALNILAAHPDWLGSVPENTILTPHPGEFTRLFGADANQYDRIQRLPSICMKYGIIIVLKGAHTITALPNGELWFNSTGNAGMATAGSGDSLTGIVLSLLARGLPADLAARWAVYLHGKAGDLAAAKRGKDGLLASDLIDQLGLAFEIEKNTI